MRAGARDHRGTASRLRDRLGFSVASRQRGYLAAGLGVEPVAREQGVGALPTLAGVGHAGERPLIAGEQPLRGHPVGRPDLRIGSGTAFVEDRVDDRAVHALLSKLLPDRPLTARTSAVAGFHPGSREHLVVEHPQVRQADDRRVHQLRPVAGPGQPTAHFGFGPRSGLEEPRGGLEHDLRVVDLGMLRADLAGVASTTA